MRWWQTQLLVEWLARNSDYNPLASVEHIAGMFHCTSYSTMIAIQHKRLPWQYILWTIQLSTHVHTCLHMWALPTLLTPPKPQHSHIAHVTHTHTHCQMSDLQFRGHLYFFSRSLALPLLPSLSLELPSHLLCHLFIVRRIIPFPSPLLLTISSLTACTDRQQRMEDLLCGPDKQTRTSVQLVFSECVDR